MLTFCYTSIFCTLCDVLQVVSLCGGVMGWCQVFVLDRVKNCIQSVNRIQSAVSQHRFVIESLARCQDRTESDSLLNRFVAFR